MNINRHNYEEFFILYMDNELGSDDRRMVEAFVLQHPDLKEELDLLFQYKLSPDTGIVFPGKEELMRVKGENPVTLTNYGDWLLLYTDNELNADQRKEVENFTANNPAAEKELALLQRCKLQPEHILFPGKESLYKKEEKVRALPVKWWRVAAAAVLLLGIGITTVVVLNNKPRVANDFARDSRPGEKTKTNTTVVTPGKKEIVPVQEIALTEQVKQVPAPGAKKQNKNPVVKYNTVAVKKNSPVKKEEPVIADHNKPSNNLPQPVNNPTINKNDAGNNALANKNPSKEIPNQQESFTNHPVTNPPAETSPVKNPEIMYASLEEGGKNKKNRGFLRKLARTFEKRTNMTATDDDRLLVGGLSFKLK